MTRTACYVEALKAERAAWDQVRESLPGSPAFDSSKWSAWQAAITVMSHEIEEARPRKTGSADFPGH
jgi:hypothetical protein